MIERRCSGTYCLMPRYPVTVGRDRFLVAMLQSVSYVSLRTVSQPDSWSCRNALLIESSHLSFIKPGGLFDTPLFFR